MRSGRKTFGTKVINFPHLKVFFPPAFCLEFRRWFAKKRSLKRPQGRPELNEKPSNIVSVEKKLFKLKLKRRISKSMSNAFLNNGDLFKSRNVCSCYVSSQLTRHNQSLTVLLRPKISTEAVITTSRKKKSFCTQYHLRRCRRRF